MSGRNDSKKNEHWIYTYKFNLNYHVDVHFKTFLLSILQFYPLSSVSLFHSFFIIIIIIFTFPQHTIWQSVCVEHVFFSHLVLFTVNILIASNPKNSFRNLSFKCILDARSISIRHLVTLLDGQYNFFFLFQYEMNRKLFLRFQNKNLNLEIHFVFCSMMSKQKNKCEEEKEADEENKINK